jgi:RNA recognition motif-containing protein
MLKGKNQAFVQMQDLQSTTALVQYYSQVQANIRGKPVYFQYSNRSEITTQENEKPNHILLVTVMNLVYPVTIDILHQVFSKYGAIHKMIIFSKKGFQSLIQFQDKSSAQAAKQALDGQNIYSGCCTLRIQYSTFQNLNVKFNNDKSRDFTDNTLPSGDGSTSGSLTPFPTPAISPLGLGLFPESAYGGYIGAHAALTGYGKAGMGVAVTMGPSVLIVSGFDPERVSPDTLFVLFGVYGDVTRVKILYNKTDTALIQFASPQQAETALNNLNQCPLFGRTLLVNFSKHTSISLPREATEGAHLTKDYTNSPLHRFKVAGSKNFQHICPPSPVLHLSNLPSSASEEEIKALFSRYGTVVGFKFFAKDRRMALVEMESVAEAVEALVCLHDYRLEENNIRVSFSKSSL